MKLTVKNRGKLLDKVDFWGGREQLDAGELAVFVGANGAGKSVTMHAIAAGQGAFDSNSSSDDNMSPLGASEFYGQLAGDDAFDLCLKFRGDRGTALPSAVHSMSDLMRLSAHKMSHGEASLNIIAHEILVPLKEALQAGKRVLVLLDEPEAGVNPEGQTIVGLKLADLARDPKVTMVVATQSDRIRAKLLQVHGAVEHDFGGWLQGNPWQHDDEFDLPETFEAALAEVKECRRVWDERTQDMIRLAAENNKLRLAALRPEDDNAWLWRIIREIEEHHEGQSCANCNVWTGRENPGDPRCGLNGEITWGLGGDVPENPPKQPDDWCLGWREVVQ
jgi:predicted ATPase